MSTNAKAGGANTTVYGKKFEEKTNNGIILLTNGFSRCKFNDVKSRSNSFIRKQFGDKTVTFMSQNAFKLYVKCRYNIDAFRTPDEAYIIEYAETGRTVLKILEKKEQRVEGSVETKLWSAPSLKREYELICKNKFEVEYGFCVNSFLKNKLQSNHLKYKTLNTILHENRIPVFFGEDDNYFDLLSEWIMSQ